MSWSVRRRRPAMARVAAVSAVAALGALTFAGCGSSGAQDAPASGGAGEATSDSVVQGTAALTIGYPDGAVTTESHNPFVAGSSINKYRYGVLIFEPLAMVNLTGDLDVTPWLAETLEWNDDYTELTVKARSDVKWSDGEDFSADDIAYTFQMFMDGTLLDTSALKLTDVSTDGDKVTLAFEQSMFTRQIPLLHTKILPKHIWENLDDPQKNPLLGDGELVGTGPYSLSSWSTESATVTARDDWWGGELAVPTINFVSFGDNAGLATALASGDVDWAQAFIPQLQSSFLDADPDNRFYAAPTSMETIVVMNVQQPPFDDVALRKAMAYTIDRDEWVDIAREGVASAIWNKTGLPELLADEIIPEYADDNYSVDKDEARKILSEAGYTWDSNDALIGPDGSPISFRISAPAGWSDWNSMQQLIANQVNETLGAEVKIDTPEWGGWDEGITEGKFDMTLHWTETTNDAYGLYTSAMDPRWIVDDKAGYNFGRYDNPVVTEALNAYSSGASDEERDAALAVIEKAFVEDVPVVAIGTGDLLAEYNTRNYVGWPDLDDPYAPGDPQQPTVVQILQRLRVKG